MLVNFYIDPEAVDNDTNRSHVRGLRRKWRTLGVLTHPSQDDGGFKNIRRKFLHLDQSIQRIWARVWREIENDTTCYPRCKDNFRVALVSETRAEGRQIDHGDSAYFQSESLGNNVEWVRLTEVNDSKEFERAETLAMTPISSNQPVQRLWRDRFQSLANTSQDIVIIDRYTAVESFYCRNGAHGTDCELFRLLDLIEQDSRSCTVTVYSSCDAGRTRQNPPALEDLKDSLRSEIRNRDFQNIKSVTLYLPNNHNFSGSEARDRFIRFDCKVCDIGHGIDIFKGQNVSIGATFTMNSNVETLDYIHRIEAYLENSTNRARNIVRVP